MSPAVSRVIDHNELSNGPALQGPPKRALAGPEVSWEKAGSHGERGSASL